MAAPPPAAQAIPKQITHHSTRLLHKSSSTLHYTFASSPLSTSNILLVFVNGLMSDKTTWLPAISAIIRSRSDTFPSMLCYDRYGQGLTTDSDPQDEGKEKGHGHDCADAAEDLRRLLEDVCMSHLETRVERMRLVLVANSIGVAVARLYAQGYPIFGLLILDSIMADSSFDFWPDPDASEFKSRDLPDDVTVEVLREQRKKFLGIFKPDVTNKEGLSRRDLHKLLPHSDRPMLGTKESRPWVTVVGHGFEAFAEESYRTMGTPKGLSMKYSNPIWEKYNQGLAKLTDLERSKGPFQAKGCGHFIQRDDPMLVANEALELVDKVANQPSTIWKG